MQNIPSTKLGKDPRYRIAKTSTWHGSVLLRDEIKYYVDHHELIDKDSFSNENLKPASYNLTLGSEHRLGGKPVFLSENNRYLEIPPFQVAVVSTREKLKLPLFLIGRWNIRVTCAYEGLLWAGGPQVDPGYEGHLYAPIYNLSNRRVMLELHKPFATIDFVRTTPYTRISGNPFQPTREDTVSSHDIHQLSSGPFEVHKTLAKLEKRMDTFQATVFPLIALIFTALAIISGMPELTRRSIEDFVQVPILMVIVAAVAIFISGWILGRNAK
jgi:deoxycytidine triphosphate deaminase